MKSKKSPSVDLETIIPILIGVWRRFHKISGPPDVLQTREFRGVVTSIQKLQSYISEGKSPDIKDYFSTPDLLGAYLLYYWVVHYQQGLSLIGELPEAPKRVLDVCSGPSPFAFAALRHGAEEVIATDQNLLALTLGAQICGKYGMPLTIRPWNCVKEPLKIEGKFDLIILGHGLNELFPTTEKGWVDKQNTFAKTLLNKLTPNGYLLIVDGSFPEENKRLLQLRDHLVEKGVAVQAPCVWKGECPALKVKNSPCYAQREFEKPYMIKEIQRAASIKLSSLKMSYIIFRSPSADWPTLPEENLYRVISPPFDSFHGKRFYLCGTDGKKQLGTHLSTYPQESRAFEYLKRGELISIEDGLVNQNAIDIVQDTKLKVIAACGKPLPEPSRDE